MGGAPWESLPPLHIKVLRLPLRPDKAAQLEDRIPRTSNSFGTVPAPVLDSNEDQGAHLLHGRGGLDRVCSLKQSDFDVEVVLP